VVHGCDSRAGDRCGSFWYRFPSLLRAGCLAVSTLRWPRRPKRQQGCHRLSISSPQKSKAAPLTSSTALGAPSTDGLQNTISRNAGSGEPPGDQWSIAATRSKLSEFLGFAAAKTRPPAKKRSSGRAFSCAAAMPASRSLSRVAAICTAPVQLRFDAARSPNLDASTRARLRPLAGRRMTADGVVVIIGRRFRTQERNRQDAYERLIDLIHRAAEPEKRCIATRPTAASRERRREIKLARGRTKRLRRPVDHQVE